MQLAQPGLDAYLPGSRLKNRFPRARFPGYRGTPDWASRLNRHSTARSWCREGNSLTSPSPGLFGFRFEFRNLATVKCREQVIGQGGIEIVGDPDFAAREAERTFRFWF